MTTHRLICLTAVLCWAAVGGLHAQSTSKDYIRFGGRVIAIENQTLSIVTGSLGGTMGVTYGGSVTGSGGTAPYHWSVASGSLPPGLQLATTTGNSITSCITGSPTASGSYSVTLKVTDSAPSPLSVTQPQSMTIVVVSSLSFTSSIANGVVGQSYSGTVTASGGTPPYGWSYTGTMPPGLTQNPSTGTISGTPTSLGSYPITVKVTDFAGATATQSPTVQIVSGLSISSISSAGVSGLYYSQTAGVSGGTAPYSWSVSTGTLPTGLNLNQSTGTISGTPTGSGTSSFTLAVTDSTSPTHLTATQAFSIGVLAITTTTPVPPGPVNTPYSFSLGATGGTATYAWSLGAGSSLPSGMTLSTTGVLSGTPSIAGTFEFTPIVTSGPVNTSATLSITIGELPIAITTSSLPSGAQGDWYSSQLQAAGGTSPYAWSMTGTLPAGLSLSSGGTVYGTPTSAASAQFTAIVVDGRGASASRIVSITIVAAITISPSAVSMNVGQSVTLTASQSVTWTLSSGLGTLTTTGPSNTTVYQAPSSLSYSQSVKIIATAGVVTRVQWLSVLTGQITPSLVSSQVQGHIPATVGQPTLFTMSAGASDNWNNSGDYLILNFTPSTTFVWDNACVAEYQPTTQMVWLLPDNGNPGEATGGTIGTSTILANSRCSVNLGASSASPPNNTVLVVNLSITFSTVYGGSSKATWVYPWTAGQSSATWTGYVDITQAAGSISVTPPTVTLTLGGTRQFSATVTNETNTAVNWSISPAYGSISSSGIYTAPIGVPGASNAVTVTATSQADGAVAGNATMSLALPVDLHLTTLPGGSLFKATNSIVADTNVVVGGAASVTFSAGSVVKLEPGFRATAGSGTPAFHANVDTQMHWP